MSELRQAARALCRIPGTTALSILTLGLGIAAATTTFSAAYAALLRALPFVQSERLTYLHTTRQTAAEGVVRFRWSYPMAGQVRSAAASFASLATYSRASVGVAADRAADRTGSAEQMDGEVVSAGYFETLRVTPAIGRTFTADEERPGHPVAVIGDGLWRRKYGADPSITRRSVIVNGVPLAIVGVAPAAFDGLSGHAALWFPAGMAPALTYREYLTTPQVFINLIGRLKNGVTLAQANAELAGIGGALPHSRAPGAPPATWSATAIPLADARIDARQRRALLLLLAGGIGVLLVACLNVALLWLTRARARRGELAVRVAIGASRLQLARQLLAESALISLAGAVAGTTAATWGVAWLRAALPAVLPTALNNYGQVSPFSTPAIDGASLLCAIALAALTTVLSALAPVLLATRTDPAEALSQSSRALAGRKGGAVGTLVVSQIAIAVVMLSAAVLLVRTVRHLQDGHAAFDAHVLSFWIDAPASRYADTDGIPLVARTLERIRAVPGVVDGGVNRCTPYGSSCARTPLFFPGGSTRVSDAPIVGRHYVSPGYFHTAGIRLQRGRLIGEDDRLGRPPVTVINETAARRFWPHEDPIGKHVLFGFGEAFTDPSHPVEIVGVVADAKYWPTHEPVGPDFYTSYRQFVWPSSLYVVKVADAGLTLPAIRRAVAAIDPALTVYDVRRLEDTVTEAVTPSRFIAMLTALFGASAAALAALGVFGVMGYAVSVRRDELALRLALGASPAALHRGVLRDAVWMAIGGGAAGIVASVWLLPPLRAMLYGVSAIDPLALGAAVAAMTIVALLAAAVPAWRASTVDPLSLLRR